MKLFLPIILKKYLNKIGFNFLISLAAIALPIGFFSTRALPQSVRSHQISAKNEDIRVGGENGNYEVNILVNSSQERVWKVLTNYNDLSRFIPDIVASKIIENKGNQKVIDQVYLSSYTFWVKAKIRLQITESYLKGLEIELIKADYLKSFQANWSIKNNSYKKSLLTYTLKIDPKVPFGKDVFFEVYKERLIESMISLKKEIESRS